MVCHFFFSSFNIYDNINYSVMQGIKLHRYYLCNASHASHFTNSCFEYCSAFHNPSLIVFHFALFSQYDLFFVEMLSDVFNNSFVTADGSNKSYFTCFLLIYNYVL